MVTVFVFFLKQKTAYEMRISDWSSDVCSSDLTDVGRYRITRIDAPDQHVADHFIHVARDVIEIGDPAIEHRGIRRHQEIDPRLDRPETRPGGEPRRDPEFIIADHERPLARVRFDEQRPNEDRPLPDRPVERAEEHTSELQSLKRISYAVICWQKNTRRH